MRHFSFLKVCLPLLLFALTSCQGLKTREEVKHKNGVSKSESASQNSEPVGAKVPDTGNDSNPNNNVESDVKSDNMPVAVAKPKDIPKIGLVFGSGGAKTMASVGILKELQRLKIPIHSVAGVELGAYVAATFAKNRLANDVEWQFAKLDAKAFGSTQSSEKLTQFLSLSWTGETLDSLRAPFACSSLHIGRQQSYVLAKGVVRQVLSYCMSYPPIFLPFDQSVADLHGVKALADYLRQRGANHVVFINFLSSENKTPRSFLSNFDQIENIAWAEASAAYKIQSGVDFVLNVNTDSFGILNFDKKKELISTGQEQSKKLILHLQEKFGL